MDMVEFIENVIGYKLKFCDKQFIKKIAKMDKDCEYIPVITRNGLIYYAKIKHKDME